MQHPSEMYNTLTYVIEKKIEKTVKIEKPF